MEMAKIGYARVSSTAQDYQGQVEALKAAGCERIYSEKVSGKSIDKRVQFQKLMRDILPGDTVYVAKLDRLARSSRDLANILHEIEAQGCGFVSLGESWCDTSTPVGKLMTTVMSGIAEFERGIIKARCDEGIARARKLKVKFGRKAKLNDEQKRDIAKRRADGETFESLALEYDVGLATIYRALNA
jgi:DNA invertase Pin-like site-specific DNA recombinase